MSLETMLLFAANAAHRIPALIRNLAPFFGVLAL